MRANTEHKTMDMETRDTDYFFQAYLLSYLYVSHNEDPVKVIMPKFPGFPHPRKPGVVIPIEWVDPDSPIAVEIEKNGGDIPAVSMPVPEEVIEKPAPIPAVPPAKAAIKQAKDRPPKMPPGGDIGTGHPDNLASRDTRADRLIARDLIPEPGVDESKEVDADIVKSAG